MKILIRSTLLVSTLAVALAALAAEPDRPYNFVVLLADDLGYGDPGCFGSTLNETPNIDRMASEGMRFTDFYSAAPVCSPSRAALLTGCYPLRINMHVNENTIWPDYSVLWPGDAKGLSSSEVTVADILHKAGYATACIGKWHLGDQPPFFPTRHGFGSFFGLPYSNDMGLAGRDHPNLRKAGGGAPLLPLMRDEEVIETEPDQSQLTRRFTEEAVRFMEKNRGQPFFLYLPFTSVHTPLFAGDAFRGKSRNGLYGDVIAELDWATGRILETLKELGIDNRTIVVFTSDNGGATWNKGMEQSNLPLRGHKGDTWEGGMRMPCVMRCPGLIPSGGTCRELATMMDLLPTFAKLAGTSAPTDRVIDGRDILPLMAGYRDARSPHEAFYYYRMHELQAVRSGPWKLHLVGHTEKMADGSEEKTPPGELFDLDADIGETKNVAAQHPDVVAKLRGLADKSTAELGEAMHGGKNRRPAGHVDNPQFLTKRVCD
jgi:arylsulfatase A